MPPPRYEGVTRAEFACSFGINKKIFLIPNGPWCVAGDHNVGFLIGS